MEHAGSLEMQDQCSEEEKMAIRSTVEGSLEVRGKTGSQVE